MVAVDKAIKKDGLFTEAYWLKSDIYLYNNNWQKQVETLRLATRPGMMSVLQTRLKLGQSLYGNGQYAEALEVYQTILSGKSPGEKIIEFTNDKIKRCEFGIRMKANPLPNKPVHLGEAINTKNHDYWPSLRGDETEMVTTVLLPEKVANGIRYQEDFYISRKKNGEWSPAIAIGKPVNTENNEGAQCLSPDGKVLFFTACNRFEGSGSCDIFISFKDGVNWSYPMNPGAPLNTESWEGHPSVSADGKTLFFSSERPGGKGGRDLWQINFNIDKGRKVTFGALSNLGDSINTSLNEISPFIHSDGKTLYFSSDGGHMGMGKNDIFIARMQADSTWAGVRNLGYPVNTHHDEIGFIVNAGATIGYFSSEGMDQLSDDKDIYSVELPRELQPSPVTYLTGKIFDEFSGQPLSAAFELFDLENGRLLQSTSADGKGEFFMMLPTGMSYALNVKHAGYLFYSDQFLIGENFSLDSPFVKQIPLKEIKTEQVIVLKNILFDFDSWKLKDGSFAELQNLTTLMRQNPGMKIEVSGHTDATGTKEHNAMLSEKRAMAVVAYLKEQGIGLDRMTAVGFGSERLLVPDPMAAENRRTEFRVVAL